MILDRRLREDPIIIILFATFTRAPKDYSNLQFASDENICILFDWVDNDGKGEEVAHGVTWYGLRH